LCNAKGDADSGVGEGHDGGDGGEPPYLVQVGDLREDDLHDTKHGDVRTRGGVARVLVSLPVETAGPLDRPVHDDGHMTDVLMSLSSSAVLGALITLC
jgi:hypothetical protein